MKKFFVSLMLFVSCFGAQAQDETCPEGTVQYIVAITVDYYGSETGFYINENPDMIQYDGVNDPISSLGPIVYSIPAGTYPDLIQGQTFFEEVCLTNGCYSFSIYDTWGDGIGFTNGSYQLLVGDSVVLFGGGNFGAWDSQVFCVDSAIEILSVLGCTDTSACNYYPGATEDDGSCLFHGSPCAHENPLITNAVFNENCFCEGSIIYGCTDSLAMNYNPEAAVSDGQCYYTPGCTEILACNYNPLADWNDGSCDFVSCMVIGCMDELANNYDSLATLPNPNACLYQTVSFSVVQNCKEVMLINTTPDAPVAGPGVFFIWEFGDGESLTTLYDTLYYGYENGSYTITLIYAQGMSLQSVSYDITVSDFLETPELQLVGQTLVCSADAVEYRWFLDQVEIAVTSDNALEVNATGEYRCQLVGHGGCLASSLPYIVNTVSLEEMKDVQPFIAPTLVNTDFTVRNIEGLLSIYDISGQGVWEGNVYNGVRVDCSFLASGTYVVRLPNWTTLRFVKN